MSSTAASPTIETVLAPVDGSEAATTAVEYAVAIAAKYDATVHLLYVLSEEARRGLETDALDDERFANESKAVVDSFHEIANDASVPVTESSAYGFSKTRKLVHPGSVILDSAEEIGVDFIVLPRESMREEPGDILEKAAEYVLLYASQPVLSV
ncbi:MAG: universal stress protein [Halobacteriales archaeon]|nr:universal stress protein [Halobacteriales archaeon]